MHAQDMPQEGAEIKAAIHSRGAPRSSSKKKLPWFSCYAERWLEDTRGMTDTQARVYWDFLCILYIHEEDGALRGISAGNKWIAMELHVHINKWMAVRKFLVACGKLIENADGSLTNNKAAQVCYERKVRSEALAAEAEAREAERREYREQNPQFDLGDRQRRANLRVVGGTTQVPPTPVTPPSNQGGLPPPVTGGSCQAISQSNQRPADHTLDTHIFTSEKEEKEKLATLKARLPIPQHLIAALVDKAGEALAESLISEYYTSGLAEGAKSIPAAFPAWLKNKKDVDLQLGGGGRRSRRAGPMPIGEIMNYIASCPPPTPEQIERINKRKASNE